MFTFLIRFTTVMMDELCGLYLQHQDLIEDLFEGTFYMDIAL